jgi:hypothetical protein
MTMCAAVIAPLEASVFNECKSRVKFLEAALSGCCLITSPIPDMQVIGTDRLVLAADANAWYEALSDLPASRGRELAAKNFEFLFDNARVDGLESFGDLQ